MSYRNIMSALFGLLVLSLIATAQTPRPTPAATNTPAPAAGSAASSAGGTLAMVNNLSITLADIDPKVREVVEGLEKEIAAMRRQAVDVQVGIILLEAEAKKRSLTVEQLVKAEVSSKISDPTEEEIKKVFDANRNYFGTSDLAQVRPAVIREIRNRRGQQVLDDYINTLRKSYTVTTGADVTAPGVAPSAVVVTAAGRPVTAGAINEDARIKRYIYEMRLQTYEAERRAVEVKVNNLLLEAEAKKRNTTAAALMKTEVTDKIHHPTDAEIGKFYQENKARLGGADLASSRAEIVTYLERVDQERLEQALVDQLRRGAQVRLLITEPEPLVEAISADDDPARGDANAQVTVIEFTDFQCPSCAAMQPIVEEVLKEYANRVRFVVRDFPLEQHAEARKAAEAANAANAQGKFFEYITLLFRNQSALDVASLKKYAASLGLDQARFNAALDGGTYAPEVEKDIADGTEYGVEGTPTIFVNGVRLRDLTAAGFRAALERAFRSAPPPRAAR